MNFRRSLNGQRVNLLALDRQHLAVRAEFINNQAVQATLNFNYPTSHSKTEAWYSRVALDPSRVDLSIACSRTEKIIGFCGFIGIDRSVRKAEHYIFIGDTDYWGKGYGFFSYKMLVNFGFTELGLNRIWGYQLEGNESASRVTTSIGFHVEGFLRADVLSHGELKNRYVIAMIRDEWEKNSQFDDF